MAATSSEGRESEPTNASICRSLAASNAGTIILHCGKASYVVSHKLDVI